MFGIFEFEELGPSFEIACSFSRFSDNEDEIDVSDGGDRDTDETESSESTEEVEVFGVLAGKYDVKSVLRRFGSSLVVFCFCKVFTMIIIICVKITV